MSSTVDSRPTRQRVGRDAQREAIEPGAGQEGDGTIGKPGQHQAQRARPEMRDELLRGRIESYESPRARYIGHMNDERIEARPLLGGED